jgi:hypothetical protein
MKIIDKERIDFNEGEREGYLNIFHQDGEYHIELHVGVQSFGLDYSNEDYESAKWMAKQFAHALNRMVGDVRLYGSDCIDTLPRLTKPPPAPPQP